MYIHVYQVIKNRGPGPYNSLRHPDNRKYFSVLSLSREIEGKRTFYLAKEVGKIWRCSCWEKGNFIMINQFKYGQTWTIWHFPLSLSLYSTFNILKAHPTSSASTSIAIACQTSVLDILKKGNWSSASTWQKLHKNTSWRKA